MQLTRLLALGSLVLAGCSGTPTDRPSSQGGDAGSPTAKSDWVGVTAAGQHTCARDAQNGHFCWGGNTHGEVTGTASEGEQDAPHPLLADVLATGAGDDFTCVVRYPQHDDTTETMLECLGNTKSGGKAWSDYLLQSKHPWSTLAAGGRHVCALAAGALYCWGDNAHGEVGIGTTSPTPAPTRVGTDSDWSAITAGPDTTCGLRSGRLFCWGNNSLNQLGAGMAPEPTTPVQIGTDSDWQAVSLGARHTCGLRAGALYCWGPNYAGGTGLTPPEAAYVPTQVGTASDWTRVAAGYDYTCGIRTGRLFCWGNDTNGQVGDGVAQPSSPIVQVGTDTDWTDIAAGPLWACGIRAAHVLCWGDNEVGQLGDGTHGLNVTANPPTEVVTPGCPDGACGG